MDDDLDNVFESQIEYMRMSAYYEALKRYCADNNVQPDDMKVLFGIT